MSLTLTVLTVGLQFSVQVQAMDRWAALSQLETSDNDNVVGAAGEISRYQVKPVVWRRYASAEADWRNPEAALATAREIMKQRCARFERLYKRPPTDFEFYVLWNAPAQIEKPCKAVRARAERFCNLVSREDHSASTD